MTPGMTVDPGLLQWLLIEPFESVVSFPVLEAAPLLGE